jgi:hypothetical protein
MPHHRRCHSSSASDMSRRVVARVSGTQESESNGRPDVVVDLDAYVAPEDGGNCVRRYSTDTTFSSIGDVVVGVPSVIPSVGLDVPQGGGIW